MSIPAVSPNSTGNTQAASAGTSSNSNSAMDSMDVSFLNLLITELKTQDPTTPMDATQMVGQMVSLNQLNQLIAIHQLLQTDSNAISSNANSSAKGAN